MSVSPNQLAELARAALALDKERIRLRLAATRGGYEAVRKSVVATDEWVKADRKFCEACTPATVLALCYRLETSASRDPNTLMNEPLDASPENAR